MCGIVGLTWKDEKGIKKAIETLKHRGPDHQAYSSSTVSLGSVRLSILDLSSKGNMPMKKNNYTIVHNGEVYNFKEVRSKLNDRFTTGTDTEVILKAYKELGPKCLDLFNGMFAFCIHDLEKNQLFIARDRFGIKPLYYIETKKGLAFASEIKALLPFIKPEVDPEGLKQYFTFRYTIAPNTLFKGVKKLKPGHYMSYNLKSKKLSIKKYYELPVKKRDVSFDGAKRVVKDIVDRAVERRMVADVPVASLLSGGLDSSIITSLAKQHNSALNTFSIGFDTTNELSHAKFVSEELKTKHYEFTLNKDKVLSYLDKMIYHMDEPIGDPGFLPILVLSEKVKKYNKAVLSGDGADEVFVGYDKYKMFKYGKILRHFLPWHFGNAIAKRVCNMRGKDDYSAFLECIRVFDSSELRKLQVGEAIVRDCWVDCNDSLDSARMFDINTSLPEDLLLKADKMSSAFGLEQRVPFMDHELVEYAFSLDSSYLLALWKEKNVLRKAFSSFLPSKTLNRRKSGFDVPINYWFQNVLATKLTKLLEENNHSLYNKEYVYHLLKVMKGSVRYYRLNFLLAQKLWTVLMFELWYERFIK